MKQSNNQIVSAAELEALIQDWGAQPHKSVDRFFPLRFWFIFILSFFYAIWVLFWTDSAVQKMMAEPHDIERMWRFMYFRGWFIVGIVLTGCYAYFRNWYPAIVLGAIFLIASINFVFDMFNIYAEVISKPTPRTTLMLFARITALWFLYLCVKNSSRLPPMGDRLNIALPFKKNY